ncbi:polysaccharide biosynthesis tyrosine autokinase [Luteolibacter arcticus]|uniref:non-specific protein-tyrosine kinase n=1 Tax=Luteolibacter arcticus TaxID=1581411 RepID=A0ABT3GMU3_9BACT|nr:polysaccharide biosynthesis tyrosine autokinase [Luteolibacter arcticus]MCW1924847.1 polysaccharide biosynthesis tyrosine autokinase [Luteolibacter arcticus]
MNQSTNPSEVSLHAIDYWQVVKNRYGVILLTFLLVFMTALVITYVMPKKYESIAVVQVRPKGTGTQVIPGMTDNRGQESSMATFLPTEFAVIKAQKTLDAAIENLDLVNRWNTDLESVRRTLKGIVDAQDIRGTSLIEIRVRYNDPKDAQKIAKEVAEAYRERRNKLQADNANQALDELRKAVIVQEDAVEDKRKLLSQIIRTEGIIYSGDQSVFQGSRGFDQADDAESAARAYVTLEQDKIQLESQIETLLKYDGPQLMNYASGLSLPDNIIPVLLPQFQTAKREYEGMKSQGRGERHPMMISSAKMLEEMEKDLVEAVANLRETLKAKLALSQEQLSRLKTRMDLKEEEAIKGGIAAQSFVDAKNDFETAQRLLEQLKVKQISEEMQTRITEEPIIMHEEPMISGVPVSPNVTLNLALGAVVGMIFGVGVAFFLEYLDTSVKSLEDVERYLQVPVLAVIPKDVGVLYKQSGMSPDAEAYRILRTNIEFNRKNPEDNAITVVSGGAGEGKSTTLVNLAYICAQGGYTTLMIDADLRRPRLHTFFDINNSVGLTNYLTTELMLEDVILQTPVDNLYFMPSGILPADAAGILNSRRMSELIQDVKQRFDLVLVDSPPILGVSDASVLASEVDLTMIVVQHRKLPRNMLMRVKQAVENVGGHVIGVVLNNVDVRSDSQYQYYTSYYTYYAPAESQPMPTSSASQGATQPPSPRQSPRGSSSSSDDSKQDLY